MQTNHATLTRAELASELGVSVFTLNQWAVSGKGPRAIRVGRQSVYRRTDVDAYKAGLQADKPAAVMSGQPHGAYMMRFPDVQAAVGLGKSTIYSMVKAGGFPAPVKLGPRAVGWPSHLVQQWLADRINRAEVVE